MAQKEPPYSEAIEELRQIMEEIEEADISVDELTQKVDRASYLIKVCRGKLKNTKEDVDKILKELEEGESKNES